MSEQGGIAGRLAERLKDKKTARILVLVGLAGMALILLSGWIGDRAAPKKTEPTADKDEAYRAAIEQSLTEMVANIVGSERVRVLVTLETGTQYLYANEVKQNTDKTEDSQSDGRTRTQQKDQNEQKYIIINAPEGGEVALLVTELAPAVKGVVVSCQNGEQEKVCAAVTNAVTTALDITAKRVCVLGFNP